MTPFCRELVGSSVALGSNSAVEELSGEYLTAAPILVEVPFLKSLKVLPFSKEEAIISSEKKAVTLVVVATPLASVPGSVLVTLGGPGRSVVEVGGVPWQLALPESSTVPSTVPSIVTNCQS